MQRRCMGRRSGDLAGSREAFAARWQGLLDCTCSPCQQRSVHKNVAGGGGVSLAIAASPSSAQCQGSGQSVVMKYLLTFCQRLPPGTRGTTTSPTSQHCWEPGQCQRPRFTGGRTRPSSCCLTHPSHTQSASSPGQAAPTAHLWPPAWDTTSGVGSASPHRHAGCWRSSSPQ